METIAQTLIAGLRDHAQHANAEGDPTHLNLALVRAALKSENANLHNLVFQYLKEVGTEDADKLMSVLMEEAVSDPIYNYDNYNSSEVAILFSRVVAGVTRVPTHIKIYRMHFRPSNLFSASFEDSLLKPFIIVNKFSGIFVWPKIFQFTSFSFLTRSDNCNTCFVLHTDQKASRFNMGLGHLQQYL